jgi:hypothetical protein|nr:MAG TPA: hypothetical protein [Caudoviricetes sp.]
MVCEYQYHVFLSDSEPTKESVKYVMENEMWGKYKHFKSVPLSDAAEIIVGKFAHKWELEDKEVIYILIAKADNSKKMKIFKVFVEVCISVEASKYDL